jgi:hypothetical protein
MTPLVGTKRWLVAVFAVMLLPHASRAQMLPIFGPKPFVRGTGTPQTVVETFRNCEPEGAYKLVVVNGHPDGTARSSSATIVLNGIALVRPDEFSQHVARIEKPLTLGPVNQLEVLLSSAPGSALTISVECTGGCLDVEITSPSAEDDVSRIDTVVRGRVTSSDGEAGVAVNEILGHVRNGSFAVPKVPLSLGTNALIATVTNSCSQTASRTTIVTKTTEPTEYVVLTGSPVSGAAPMQAEFSVLPAGLGGITNVEWDFDGDGVTDASGANLRDASHTYSQHAIYVPTVTVTDGSGQRVTDRMVVDVIAPDGLNLILRNKILAMQSALVRGNLPEAAGFITAGQRAAYLASFEAASDLSPAVDMLSGVLIARERVGRFAVYDLTRTINGIATTSQVVFVLDADGIWRVNQF